MTAEEQLVADLARHEAEWLIGEEYVALIKALLLCRNYGAPLPDWLTSAITAELMSVLKERQAAKTKWQHVHRVRWSVAADFLKMRKEAPHLLGKRRPTRADAFAAASKYLAQSLPGKHPAQATPDIVEKSYNKVQSLLKKHPQNIAESLGLESK